MERLLLHFVSLVASAVPTETFVRKTERGSCGIDPPAGSERTYLSVRSAGVRGIRSLS